MKKIVVAFLVLVAVASCNNSPKDADRDKNDSLNMNTNGNTDNAADHVPYNKKDTSSYERMPSKMATDTSK